MSIAELNIFYAGPSPALDPKLMSYTIINGNYKYR
jgi:hypothetical protein